MLIMGTYLKKNSLNDRQGIQTWPTKNMKLLKY